MALRFIDSFDHYATADATKKGWTFTGVGISTINGRRGTGSLTASGSWTAVKVLDNQPTWIVGCAFKCTTLPSSTAIPIIDIRDAATSQCDLRINSSGTLSVTRGGTVLGITTATIPLAAFVYIELLITVHASAGVAKIMLNSNIELSLTGINTQNNANAYANTIRLGPNPSSTLGFVYYDDLYICDGTGSAPHNTFLGDCRVDALFPNGDGTHQTWTPSTAGTHYTLVDEATPNTTDYVSSSTVGQRETYQMQNLTAATGTIYGAQLNAAILKSDAGARSYKSLILSSASESLGAVVALSVSQIYGLHIQTTDPATSVAWTESGINAAQCGVETV